MAFSIPKVSIVVPTYNNKKVLEKVLDAMLILDYPNDYEIIVVDDGSSDGTIDMLHKKFDNQRRIRVLGQGKNKGVCKARNMGIHAAKYPIIVNMDHTSDSYVSGIQRPQALYMRARFRGFWDLTCS